MKLRIAVCDDEPIICKEIKEKIICLKSDYEIDLYQSGKDLLKMSTKYDVIFLDIEMPDENGMNIAKKLRSQRYQRNIVFLTSHTEFMPEAFKVKAFRFLEKPIEESCLEETLSQLENEIFSEKRLIVNDYGSVQAIYIDDIIFVEADQKKTSLVLKDAVIKTGQSLKYWMQELGARDFFQVHKSFIVSLKYIRKIEDNKIYLNYSEREIPISRRNYAAARKAFFDFIKENARCI